MANTTIGMDEIKNYEIKLGEHGSITFEGTQEAMWKHVTSEINARGLADSGVIPHPRVIEPERAPEPAPEPITTPEPVSPPVTHREAVSAGVDAEGAARSTTDLLALQASGFAPARPYFDRGTPVIGMGVDNARASAREHEAKPRVGEAVQAFVDHVASENRRDVVYPLSRLLMRSTGQLSGDNPAGWTVEPQALPQLASRLGIEQPSFLNHVWPDLRAQVWNQHIATAVRHPKSTCPETHPAYGRLGARADNQVMCRLRDDTNGDPSLWAALSERYTPFDVDRIAQALEIGMRGQPDARCEIQYDGTGATFDVLFHSDVEPARYVAGEFFKVGLRVRTSDSGGGSVNIGLLAYQNLCLNLICIDVGEYQLDRLRHMGDVDKLADRFRKAIETGNSKLSHFLRAWGYATDAALCESTSDGYRPTEALRLLDEMETETISEADLLTGIFTGLAKSKQVNLGKRDLPGLVAAHARDTSGAVQVAPVTRASIVNAITRHAHEHVGRTDPQRQAELEREAGALIAKPLALPFMPPRETVAV